MWRQLMVLFLGVVCFCDQSARAQENPLKISVRSEWEGVRTSAPISLRAFLKWPKPELLEGHLQFNTFVNQQKISHWTSLETALSGSEQYLRFMTPRPILEDKFDRYVLEAEFIGNHPGLVPEQLDVEVPVRQKRAMVVGIVVDNRSTIPKGFYSEVSPNPFERPLTLQGYLAPTEASDLEVYLTRVNPVDLPTESLRYLGLDALLISYDMLDVLRPSQRDALRVWVLAGGSLALVQTGDLGNGAASFVTDLSRNAWSIQQAGVRQLPKSVQVYAPGLGQFIHATEPQLGESREWTRVAHLLLRLTPDRAGEIETSGTLELRAGPRGESLRRGIVQAEPVVEAPLAPLARFNFTELSRLLVPDTIRGMPLWLAASVLAGCLICVGPIDYFLLGAIRKRRWTWALFPLVALGFTGWMAHLAAEHNGRNDSRNWISIVDMTADNEVVRTSRIELTYGASGRTVSHDVKDQWWTDLNESDLLTNRALSSYEVSQRRTRFANAAMRPDAAPNREDRLSYAGSVPGHYVVDEPVRQWAPRMQRITTLGKDPELADYPLPQLDWSQLASGKRSTVNAYLKQHLPEDWQNAVWMIRSPTRETEWTFLNKSDSLPGQMADLLNMVSGILVERWGTVQIHLHEPRPVRGIYSLLTEISPTAGPDCEDLIMTSRPTLILVNEVAVGRYLVLRVVFAPE